MSDNSPMTMNSRFSTIGLLLLVASIASAQQESFHITPLHPVEQLRVAALKLQPPAEQGPFRPTDLVELITLDSGLKLDIRLSLIHI